MTAGEPFNPTYKSCGFFPDEVVHRIPQKQLKDGPKLLYTRLIRWAGTKGTCWYGYEGMAEELGKSRSQVIRDMKALENHKLVAHEVRGWKGGKRQTNVYRFLWHPMFDEKKLSAMDDTQVGLAGSELSSADDTQVQKSCVSSEAELSSISGQSWVAPVTLGSSSGIIKGISQEKPKPSSGGKDKTPWRQAGSGRPEGRIPGTDARATCRHR